MLVEPGELGHQGALDGLGVVVADVAAQDDLAVLGVEGKVDHLLVVAHELEALEPAACLAGNLNARGEAQVGGVGALLDGDAAAQVLQAEDGVDAVAVRGAPGRTGDLLADEAGLVLLSVDKHGVPPVGWVAR